MNQIAFLSDFRIDYNTEAGELETTCLIITAEEEIRYVFTEKEMKNIMNTYFQNIGANLEEREPNITLFDFFNQRPVIVSCDNKGHIKNLVGVFIKGF